MKPYLAFLVLFIFACSSNKQLQSDRSNCNFNDKNEKINLFAFIGEKVSIEEFDPNKNNIVKVYDPVEKDTILKIKHVMDRAFRVKYKILKKIFNDLKTDTIEFIVYDHYGTPNFEKYKNVILYISKNSDGNYYFLQKYQYDVVYKDDKDNWFGYIQNKKSKKKKKVSLETIFNNKRNNVFKELFTPAIQ